MAEEYRDKILEAMKDMKRDLIIHFDNSVQAVKDTTKIELTHIKEDIVSLKRQSDEHYKKDEKILGQVAEIVVEHTQMDARHVEEVDQKIDVIGGRFNMMEHRISEKVDKVDNRVIAIEEQENGKKKQGNSITTWVGFVFMVLLGLVSIYGFIKGETNDKRNEVLVRPEAKVYTGE